MSGLCRIPAASTWILISFVYPLMSSQSRPASPTTSPSSSRAPLSPSLPTWAPRRRRQRECEDATLVITSFGLSSSSSHFHHSTTTLLSATTFRGLCSSSRKPGHHPRPVESWPKCSRRSLPGRHRDRHRPLELPEGLDVEL